MTSIKVTNNSITRKLHVNNTSSWDGIIEHLSNVFALDMESLELTYVDCDNVVITLSTITELQDAMNDGIKTFCLSSQVSKIIFYHKSKKEFIFFIYIHVMMSLI